MLTININHIRCETMTLLHIEPYLRNYPFLEVLPKGQFGKFIYILDKDWYAEFIQDEDSKLPADLVHCLNFALKYKCNILCLDPNADIVDELYVYDD